MSELLTTYLQDHHAGASGGMDAFDRVAQGHSDPEVRAAVARIGADVAEDEKALEDLMAVVGASTSTLKDLATAVGEKVSRLKPNERVAERSPLSDLVELEALVDAVHAKGLMWKALSTLDDPRLNRVQMQELSQRADAQRDELEALRLTQAHKLLAE